MDRGFFFTTMQLITNPRLVIKDVLGGVTIKYVHPFRLLFIWATISTLLIVIFGTYDAQTSDMYETFGFSEEQIETQQRVNEVLKKYLSFIIMLNVPAIAFFSWLFYSKHKLNYTEHLVINSYAMALTTALGILVVFAQYFLDHPGVFMWISLISNIVIVGYVYSAFFKENYIVFFFQISCRFYSSICRNDLSINGRFYHLQYYYWVAVES